MKTLTAKEKSERARRAVDTRKKWLAGTDARAAWVTREKNVPQSKHGARVFPLGDKIIVRQTVLHGGKYILDEQKETFVKLDDDAAIGAAIREAIAGKL